MKKLVWFVLLALVYKNAASQLQFQNISFSEALEQAGSTNRMIFLQFESENCTQCNEVANKAFEDKELAVLISETFVCIKINITHLDREITGDLLNVKESFGSFFIDHNRTLIHSYKKSSTLTQQYKEQIGIALTKVSEGVRISELENEYLNDKKNIFALEALLLKRKSLNLQTDSLLNEYIILVPVDSSATQSTLIFIAGMAPIIGSPADIFLRKNRIAFNNAWYSLSLMQRIAINSAIINKSTNKAIKEKNEAFVYRVAAFNKLTYTNNLQTGEKAFDKTILRFYHETKDTFNYLVRAVNYYDKYYMTVPVDSISKEDSLRKAKILTTTKGDTLRKDGNTIRITKKVSFSPQAQIFTQALNTGAWNFYKMSNDPMYIDKALQWAKRAIEFYESAEVMDTYARLLYKSGKKEEAMFWEEKTIALRQKRGFPVTEFEAVLNKMKNSIVKID